MAKYVISYDYHKQRDYTALYKLLSRWKAKRILDSLWFANLNGDAEAVLEALIKAADKDDCFVVIQLMPDCDWAYTAGVQKAGADWIEANL